MLGRPTELDHVLDLSALSGVSFYEPAELVVSAGPATPVAEVEALLNDHNQQMAFEPPDLGPLLGNPVGGGTLGGLLACNLAGPRRIKNRLGARPFSGLHRRKWSGRDVQVRGAGRQECDRV